MLLALQLNALLVGEEGGAQFIGPSIASFQLVVDVAMTARNYSSLFTGDGLTFGIQGTLPGGLSLSSAGALTGAPVATGTFASLRVRATDSELDTADSNEFTITVIESPWRGPRDRRVYVLR